MVVDIAAELPGEDVEVEIVEVEESIVDMVGFFLDAPLRLDSGSSEVAELRFGAEGDESGLEVMADSVEFGLDNARIKHTSGGPGAVLDVINEVVLPEGHRAQALVEDQINSLGV